MNTDIYGNLMLAMSLLVVSAVLVPLIGAKRKLAGWMNFIFISASAAILLFTSAVVIFSGSEATSKLVSIGPLGVYFLVDSFSAFFIAIISFMAVMSAFYSIQYMEHYSDYKMWGYYLNFPVFILGMVGIVTVDDLSLGFSVAWQMMTIASYFLIRFEFREKGNVRNANKYLILMELAWMFIIAGTLFIDGVSFGDSLHGITQKIGSASGVTLYLIYGLILLGFGFKAGVFPLGQLWLPDAHSIAPSPISALLSGVMIKTGVYGIIRTFFWMVPHGEGTHFNGILWGIVIASIGVATLFIGTVQSMKQSDSKRLLAYSSIGQMGYIILAVGSALFMFYSDSPYVKLLSVIAVIGAVYHILNHAVFKGLLFLTSGSVLYATGTKDLNKLGGLLSIMPVSALAAGIASLSISGVPPFSGFASKWTIISSSILAGSEVLFLVIFGIIALFTSAITLSCYVKFFGMTFTSSGAQWNVKKNLKEVPVMMIIPKVILALLCIVQGLVPFVYFKIIMGIFRDSTGSIVHDTFNSFQLNNHISGSLMGVSVSVPGISTILSSVAVPAVVFGVFIFAFMLAWLLKKSGGSEERESTTWLCGYQELNNLNRYRDRNMFAALKGLLWWTGGNVKRGHNK